MQEPGKAKTPQTPARVVERSLKGCQHAETSAVLGTPVPLGAFQRKFLKRKTPRWQLPEHSCKLLAEKFVKISEFSSQAISLSVPDGSRGHDSSRSQLLNPHTLR
jgi:hypothetical protein